MNDPEVTVIQPVAPTALRTAPGTALCLASGIMTFMTWWLPPVPFFIGVFCLLNAWRAARAARRQPERYRGSAVPLAGVVLVLLAWSFSALLLALIGMTSGEVVMPDAPAIDRW